MPFAWRLTAPTRVHSPASSKATLSKKYVSKADWHDFGQGYLLMPDPRSAHYGGETIMSFTGGRTIAVDEYGRHPGEPGYSGGRRNAGPDLHSFQRFLGEFSRLFGTERRGRSFRGVRLDEPISRRRRQCGSFSLPGRHD